MNGLYTVIGAWLACAGGLIHFPAHWSKAALRAYYLVALATVLGLALLPRAAQATLPPLASLAPVLAAAALLAGFYTPAFSATRAAFLAMLALHALGQTLLYFPDGVLLLLAPAAAFLLLAIGVDPGLRRLLRPYGSGAAALLLFAQVCAELGLTPSAAFFGLPGLALLLGLFPLAAWYPRLFQRAPSGLLACFFACQVLLALTLQARLGLDGQLAAALALLLALLGLLMTLGQNDAQRALAGIAGSQLAFLLYAGAGQVPGPAALILAQAQLISVAGLLLTLGTLAMRRGELTLARPSGQYDSYPKLATAILLFGLMSAGFPLSLAYIAEDLVLAEGFQASPWLAVGWLLVTALNALAVVKMYLYLCHGQRGREPGIDILPAKLAAALCAIGFLLVATLLLP